MRRLQKRIPIINDNIDGVHFGGVKQSVLIAHGLCLRLDAESGAIHKQDRDQQRKRNCYDADSVNRFACTHIALTHVIAVIADQHCAADPLELGQSGNEIGVVLFESYFQV